MAHFVLARIEFKHFVTGCSMKFDVLLVYNKIQSLKNTKCKRRLRNKYSPVLLKLFTLFILEKNWEADYNCDG